MVTFKTLMENSQNVINNLTSSISNHVSSSLDDIPDKNKGVLPSYKEILVRPSVKRNVFPRNNIFKSRNTPQPPPRNSINYLKKLKNIKSDNGCFRCGSPDHWARSCQNPMVCFRCNKIGHKGFNCKFHLKNPKKMENPKSLPPLSAVFYPDDFKKARSMVVLSIARDAFSINEMETYWELILASERRVRCGRGIDSTMIS